MSPPLTIYRGTTWRRRLTVTKVADGSRADLTGATINFHVKRHSSDLAPTIALAVGSGIELLPQSGGTVGQADIVVDGTVSAPIYEGIYVAACTALLSGEVVPQVVILPTKIPIRDLP